MRKAWKIDPAMPQKLAKFVGTHSLKGRMLAGAIFDKMVTDGKTTPEEWRDNKVLHEKFYEELARAEKMPREKAVVLRQSVWQRIEEVFAFGNSSEMFRHRESGIIS